MANRHTITDLYQIQSLSLDDKVQMTKRRIDDWVNQFGEDGVYVSFSGGKDSTVLAHIVRVVCGYRNIPLVFVDVPTQYPELKQFAMTFDNLEILKPKISFAEVCSKYGFPLFSKEISECISDSRKYIAILTEKKKDGKSIIPFAYRIADLIGIDRRKDKENIAYQNLRTGNIPSEILREPVRVKQLFGLKCDDFGPMYDKSRYLFMLNAPFDVSNKCCRVMKKNPAHTYELQTGRKPIIATMAYESNLRKSNWIKHGCNSFESKNPKSNPMSFWAEQDVLWYIVKNKLPICSVYGEVVVDYTAMKQCENQISFFDYGMFNDNRALLRTTKCQRTGCVLCGFGCHLEKQGKGRFELLKNTHPKFHNLLYVLKNNGITYAEAIDWVNKKGGFDIKY
ncbi:MAG: phosphoadenosine phosphosulfate reductase family protein [Clostridium sp.]|jgi:3'-phosphoadenosine 5'-phosphosulfate sulfotransferase (PAPS reductase)/FAD synthetase